MWTNEQRAELARISERDRQAAARTARRYTEPRYRGMLDATPQAEDDDSEWQYAALLGLGAFLWRGRRVPPARTRRQLDLVLTGLESEARTLAGENPPADAFALGMSDLVKTTALVGTAFAAGGWSQMTAPLLDETGRYVEEEIGYLNAFADGVADGSVRRDGRYVRRAMLYAAAGWALYQALRGHRAADRGYAEELNILSPGAGHCVGCVIETSRGWQPVGTLVPLGDRDCRSNCRCHFGYRNREGEVVE